MKHHRHALAPSALALPMASGAWPAHAADIVETLRGSGPFSTLVGAIEEAGLAETPGGEGPFTVVAPTGLSTGCRSASSPRAAGGRESGGAKGPA